MKKIISALMCVLMLAGCVALSFSASAESLSIGNDVLDTWFLDGECPGELDYVYYSPEVKEGEKYPLMIWLHGAKSGDKPRAQLEWYRFSNWASPEYQSRFKNAGGAFLLAPRSSKDIAHNWYETGCASLKATIDYFVSVNADKIDTSRIYISGYSTGGSMVWHMVTKYPDFFAAAMPIASLYNPTSGEIEKLADTSIWTFNCDKDFYASATTAMAATTFDYLKEITNRPEGLRFTSFAEAVWASGAKQDTYDKEHYIWGAVTNDMFMDSGEQYYYSTTVDGVGNTINFESPDGIISWLSLQTNDKAEEGKTVTGFAKIIAFIRNLFNKILAFFGL